MRTAFTVGVHDERRFNQNSNQLPPPAGAPPPAPPPDAIERELRRRVYFLIYGSDKTIAVLQDEPISLRDDDTFGVDIPLTVDDDLLTAAGAFPQPVHERGPSILCGFATVSRLFRLLSELLETYRRVSVAERRLEHRSRTQQALNASLSRSCDRTVAVRRWSMARPAKGYATSAASFSA